MTISELIAALEQAKKENGDIEVKVQYRDDGGEWNGHDDYIYLFVKKDGEEKFLVL